MWRHTCEDEHLAVRRVRVAQQARQPHDHHGVDEKDVAHVLVQAEVFQEEPETETVLLAGAASLGRGADGLGGPHQASSISSSSSSASLAQSHLAAPVWCCRNTVRLRRV